MTILATIALKIGDKDSFKDCGVTFGCFSFIATLNSENHESCSFTLRD